VLDNIKGIPVGCNRRRVHLDVGVEIDDERGERLRKSVDEGCIVERRNVVPREVICLIASM
jgi:hypothetical protein